MQLIQWCKSWQERKSIRRFWERIVIELTSSPAQTPLSDEDIYVLHNCIHRTMQLYSRHNYMNKQTLRLIFLLKRILADKRLFDTIKALEYVVTGHTVYKKWFMNKQVKERLVAHCWQMAQLYLIIIANKQESNPFAPGQVIRREGNGRTD